MRFLVVSTDVAGTVLCRYDIPLSKAVLSLGLLEINYFVIDMNKKASISIIVLIFIGVVAWMYAHNDSAQPVSSDQTSTHVYQSEDYGFSFVVPESLGLNEYLPTSIAVGTSTADGGFASVADVDVIESDPATTYESFDDFLHNRTEIMCAADGPGASISCTGVEQEQSFETTGGLSGTVYYLKEETKDLATGEIATAGKGPFFAFNISANNPGHTFTALVVHAPVALPADQVDSELIRSIAESVKINKIDTRANVATSTEATSTQSE
jgi:hypothetical protein